MILVPQFPECSRHKHVILCLIKKKKTIRQDLIFSTEKKIKVEMKIYKTKGNRWRLERWLSREELYCSC